MNRPIVRRAAALVGLGAIGYWVYQGNMAPSKKQAVIWGISGQYVLLLPSSAFLL